MSSARGSAALFALALLVPAQSYAQTSPPRACASSAAATLVPMTRFSPVSAVMTGPATLWVLYSDHDARNIDAVSVVEVRGLGGSHLEVDTHEVGEGTVTAGSLAIVGNNIVAAWVRPDHHVGVYVHPINGGADRRIALDAPQNPVALSIAPAGHGALVAWDDNARGLRYARLDANGALDGTVIAVPGRLGSPVVTSAFDGLVVLQNPAGAAAHVALFSPGARRAIAARGASRLAGAASTSAASTSTRGYVTFAQHGTAHLTTIDATTGAGRDRVLGPSGRTGETGIGATPWGTLAAWTHDGSIQVVPIDAEGTPASTPFEVTDPAAPEAARAPAVASTPQMVSVVWWGVPAHRTAGHTGAIRFVRLDCH